MTPAHLVQVEDRTAGAVLTCHGCTWTATIDTGVGRPLEADEYRTMRSEALVLRDAHQYPALRIGIVTIVRGES